MGRKGSTEEAMPQKNLTDADAKAGGGVVMTHFFDILCEGRNGTNP